ncbi:MAG: hypothetical protein ACYTBZ_01620, partial [Planctomycetota bacterium]
MNACRSIQALLVVFITMGFGRSLYAQRLERLEILNAGYPRAVFFQNKEAWIPLKDLTYDDWDKMLVRLNGLVSRVAGYGSIRPADWEDGNFYAEFKSKHPEKLVLVHFSGNTHSPASRSTRKYFAGHWLYYQGCLVTRDVPAERGESVLYVEDPSLFKTNMGRYGDKNEDLVICAVDPYGKPDYSQAEQLALLAVDHKAKTLRVRRGVYGTDPMAFTKNQSYVAAHVTTGPWNERGILIWAYNYSLACPRDKRGRICSEILLHALKYEFDGGGRFGVYDGIEFDVLRHSCFDPRGV